MEEVTHEMLDVTEQVIISPLFNKLSGYIGEFIKRLTPFLSHAKIGVAPPFVIADENVTGVPKHILFAEAEIVTPGVNGGVTVIIMELLLIIFPVIQLTLEESIQFIMSPLTNELSL